MTDTLDLPKLPDLHDQIAGLDAKHGIHVDGRGIGGARTFAVQDPASLAVIASFSAWTATGSPNAAARFMPRNKVPSSAAGKSSIPELDMNAL